VSAKQLKKVLKYNPESGHFTWRVDVAPRAMKGQTAGNPKKGRYTKISFQNESYYAHHIAWRFVYGYWPTGEIDHIDGDPSNNRISNLRDVTRQENKKNVKLQSNNKTGVSGVSFDKRIKRWIVKLGKKYIGCYQSEGEAIEKRKQVEVENGYHENHGREFIGQAVLNMKKNRSRKMLLFYSGSTSGESLPEQALKDKHNGKGPDIMLTFYEVYEMRGDTKTRIFRHIKRRGKQNEN
jgi:hypothetical protein